MYNVVSTGVAWCHKAEYICHSHEPRANRALGPTNTTDIREQGVSSSVLPRSALFYLRVPLFCICPALCLTYRMSSLHHTHASLFYVRISGNLRMYSEVQVMWICRSRMQIIKKLCQLILLIQSHFPQKRHLSSNKLGTNHSCSSVSA